ncbi:arsenate reductase (glutaredoxin) [Urechidicola sp. KH5]
MVKIYHNPRCRKSREGVAYLEAKKIEFETVLYLTTPPTPSELTDIINKLGISPKNLVRKSEAIWKENFKGKELSDSQIIEAMVINPKLIERPIIIIGDKAVIGRPAEAIEEIM